MSGFCGWLAPIGPTEPETALGTMAQHLGPNSTLNERREIGTRCALASAGLGTHLRRIDGVLFALQGLPVWSDSAPADVRALRDPLQACALGYRSLGEGFLDHLGGQFALAIVDDRAGRVLLALDRAGIETLVYVPTPKGIVFGSTADSVIRHPAVGAELNPQALYDYVHFHMIPGPEAVYRGLRRVLPGEVVRAGPNGHSQRHYWQPDYRHLDRLPFAERKQRLMSELQDGVRASVSEGPVGAFLSGGTDSSTVAGLLGRITGTAAHTYSIGFDAEGYDETEYARIASRHFGTDHREYYVTPDDVVNAIPLIARAYDCPFGNASAVPAYYCAKLAAADGVQTLLAGDGGDELFGGNARYAKQWIFSLYERVPAAIRNRVLEPGLEALPAAGIPRLACCT